MIEKHWLELLISPQSGKALQWDATHDLLSTEDGSEKYAIEKGVPHLLVPEPEYLPSTSEAHLKLGSKFHYREHYQKDAEVFDYFLAYEDGASRHEARRLHETIAAAVPKNARRILDVGCGNAWVAKHFCSRGKEVISMDIAPRNPEKALEMYPFPHHFALVADVYALPFSQNSLDCIIAAEIIEHVADPRQFLEKLLEVLRPGGKLIVTTPFSEKIAYSLCVHCNRPTPQHAHLHSFTKDSLAQLVRRDQTEKLLISTFSNKALTKLQTHIFLKFLPRKLWRAVDQMANFMLPKPARLMMIVTKNMNV